MSEDARVTELRRKAKRRGLRIIRHGHVYEIRDAEGVVLTGTFASADAYLRERYGRLNRGGPAPRVRPPAAWTADKGPLDHLGGCGTAGVDHKEPARGSRAHGSRAWRCANGCDG
jgi:hypothetical protein